MSVRSKTILLAVLLQAAPCLEASRAMADYAPVPLGQQMSLPPGCNADILNAILTSGQYASGLDLTTGAAGNITSVINGGTGSATISNGNTVTKNSDGSYTVTTASGSSVSIPAKTITVNTANGPQTVDLAAVVAVNLGTEATNFSATNGISSASGGFQITNATAYGVEAELGMTQTPAASLTPDQQVAVATRLASDNQASLANSGLYSLVGQTVTFTNSNGTTTSQVLSATDLNVYAWTGTGTIRNAFSGTLAAYSSGQSAASVPISTTVNSNGTSIGTKVGAVSQIGI